ncbi:MAG: Rieske 2Fe-2S domain-containing protein [Armatimonadota bacterium]
MGQKQKKTKDLKSGDGGIAAGIASPLLERIQAERGIWCLVVRDSATGKVEQAFLDYCSHKSIPLGPKAALTKKGQIRCPHHDVCFDCASGAVTDDNGKKMPHGLVPVAIESATPESAGDKSPDEKLTLTITPEHRAYLSKHLQKLDKSRKSSTKTRRKEQNHAGDINKTND